MRDLTQGPIPGHLVAMAAPIAAGMLAQTLYFLIDLYFVAQLGDAALAGVGAAGIAMFVVMALTQTLGVGTMALVSQAVGRKDPADADLVFNQAMSLALLCTVATLVGGYLLAGCYMRIVGADEPTIEAGITYLAWFMPGLALQYVNMVMISGLRGTGVVQPTMIVQIVTVILNALLAPILIAGWLTGGRWASPARGSRARSRSRRARSCSRSISASSRSTSTSGPRPGARSGPSGVAWSTSACPRAASSASCSCTWR